MKTTAQELYNPEPAPMPVLCRQCDKFALNQGSTEIGNCPGEVWRKTWTPTQGIGVTPMAHGLARICNDFVRKADPTKGAPAARA